MKSYKKHMAKFLITALAAGLLAGCGKSSGTAGGELSGTEGTTAQTDIPALPPEESGGDSQRTGAAGRYRETEVELPQEVQSQSLIRFLRGEGGILELYTAQRDSEGKNTDTFRYQYLEGQWQPDSGWKGNEVMKEKGLDLMGVFYGKDGNYYLGGTDEDYIYHLLRVDQDGSGTEILEEAFKPAEGQDYGLIPPKIEVLENGDILVYDYWEVHLYTASGTRALTLAKDFSGTTSDCRGFVEGDEFVTVNQGNIVRYSLKTGAVTETIDYSEIDDKRESTWLFSDSGGGIYAVNETGLSHIAEGGTLWEVLIDGSLNHLSMRSIHLCEFLNGDQEDFYGAFTGEAGGSIYLFRYEYDPDMAAVPPTALTVYSLEDNSTVRQAISQFQSQYPDVRVEMRTAVESGGTVTEEMIQGLNTELLSGKGADVLILDGLPVDAYIEKGVLVDLSGLVKEMEDSGDMLNNLLEGFRTEDGAVYQVPAKVAFPLAEGKPEAVEVLGDLDSMTKYEGEKPLMSIDNYENMLRKISRICYEELFGQEMKVKDRSVLIHYLESVKALGDASGCQTFFTETEMEINNVSNHVVGDGMARDVVDFDRGTCDVGTEKLTGYSRLAFPAKIREINPGSVMVPVGNLYLPSAMAGVNQSSPNQDMAREFIRCLLSYEVQKEDLYDGFPVNKKALQFLTQSDSRDNFSESVGYKDGYHLSANWPSLEVREEAAAMLETLTVPAVVDETVMGMIVEGSMDYFDGKNTVEQAADDILRKLSIYLAE